MVNSQEVHMQEEELDVVLGGVVEQEEVQGFSPVSNAAKKATLQWISLTKICQRMLLWQLALSILQRH